MKDLVIVGGGPSAMSAGVYAARMKRDVALFTKKFGGHLTQTNVIENYLDFDTFPARHYPENLKST